MTDGAIETVMGRTSQEQIRLVRFLYADHGGIIRGKASGTGRLRERMTSGIGHTVAMMAMSMLDQLQPVAGMGPVGEVRIVPDPDTFVPLPYAPGAGAMLADLVKPDGSPWEACARTFLKQAIAELASEGYGLQAAFEPEFTIGRRESSPAGPSIPDRLPPGARLRHGTRRGARGTGPGSRALLPRARPRPARDVHQVRRRAAR